MLWTMWKTPSYQQVFRFFSESSFSLPALHTTLHISGIAGIGGMLRLSFPNYFPPQNEAKKLDPTRKKAVKKSSVIPFLKNIC